MVFIPQDKLNLLHFLLTAKVKTPFYKLNVHAAMSASEVQTSLQTWIDQAEALASQDYSSDDRHFLPEIKVTVFLDEINTSSCVGVFKELMTDRTMDGKVCWILFFIHIHKDNHHITNIT